MKPEHFKEDFPESENIERNNAPEETDARLAIQEMREWVFEQEQLVNRRREERP